MFSYILSLHGSPRSGTTWLGQIVDSSPQVRYKFQPLFSRSFKDYINVHSSKREILDYYSKLYEFEDDFLDRTIEKEKGIHETFTEKHAYPKYLSTKMVRYHYLIPTLIKQLDMVKIIGIVRNPCAVLLSWLRNKNEFLLPREKFINEWEFAQHRNMFKPEEYFGYHKWKELAKLFLTMKEMHPDRFFLLRYENLVKNTYEEISTLFNFCGIEFHEQSKRFIEKSTSTFNPDPYSTFKANKDADDWKDGLNESVIRKVYSDLENSEFEIFLK